METINVYSINKLSESVKSKVLDKHRSTFVEYGWQDEIIADIKTALGLIGFDVSDIRYARGAGACFYNTRYNYAQDGLDKIKVYSPQASELIEFASRLQDLQGKHDYELCAYVTDYYFETSKRYRNIYNDVHDEDLMTIIEDICHYINRCLNDEYDSLICDKTIIACMETNHVKFTEDGKWV